MDGIGGARLEGQETGPLATEKPYVWDFVADLYVEAEVEKGEMRASFGPCLPLPCLSAKSRYYYQRVEAMRLRTASFREGPRSLARGDVHVDWGVLV